MARNTNKKNERIVCAKRLAMECLQFTILAAPVCFCRYLNKNLNHIYWMVKLFGAYMLCQ
jgi:capsule polysaccharide export protein KpsC/LpsZ